MAHSPNGSRIAWLLTLGLAFGCSKEDPKPKRTEPWRREQTPEAKSSLKLQYQLSPASSLRFKLPAKEATPQGELGVVQGSFEVDLMDLENSRGKLRVDVASVVVSSGSDAGELGDSTAARNWFGVGASVPEADRERLRWAEYEITDIDEVSVPAAHEGKLLKRPPAIDQDSGTEDAAGADASRPAEVREVKLIARGQLTLHGYKIEQRAWLGAEFEYPVAATPGARPSRITVISRRPLRVSLKTFDIRPRDDFGRFVSAGMKLFGVRVGREARVDIRLELSPIDSGNGTNPLK